MWLCTAMASSQHAAELPLVVNLRAGEPWPLQRLRLRLIALRAISELSGLRREAAVGEEAPAPAAVAALPRQARCA